MTQWSLLKVFSDSGSSVTTIGQSGLKMEQEDKKLLPTLQLSDITQPYQRM